MNRPLSLVPYVVRCPWRGFGSAGRERREGRIPSASVGGTRGGRSVQRPSRRNECRGRRGRLLSFGSVRRGRGGVGAGPRPKAKAEEGGGLEGHHRTRMEWDGVRQGTGRGSCLGLYVHTCGIGRVDPLDGSSLARAVVPQLTS